MVKPTILSTLWREQALVNAQTHINRAVFAMNQAREENHRRREECSDEYILGQIVEAVMELEKARDGYDHQLKLFT